MFLGYPNEAHPASVRLTLSMNSSFDQFSNILRDYPHQFLPPLPGRKNNKPAGILVPIRKDEHWTCFLTLRSAHLREHRFEISFPGGKPEPQDHSLRETALRECREEIGLQSSQIFGRLSSVPLYTSDYRLEPFVAWIEKTESPIANPDEVAEILPIPLLRILDLPFIDGVPFTWQKREFLSPLFLPHSLSPDIQTQRWLFGGTAHVLYELLQLVCRTMQKDLPPIRRTKTHLPFSH
ncbi:MAG: CoA pyrophosphatase [Myxococcota bacterium]|nr:CoA pyrophosphatase [Myxococcota bacterium]